MKNLATVHPDVVWTTERQTEAITAELQGIRTVLEEILGALGPRVT